MAGAVPRRRGRRHRVADLHRRRDATGWPSLHAQQLGWQRSTSIVDAPGELARYVYEAITLGHAQNLLYLTGVPLAVAGVIVLSARNGIRARMLVYAVVAVAAPLGTGSAMSLRSPPDGTFPLCRGGLVVPRSTASNPALRAAFCSPWSAAGLAACVWATYRGSGLAP